MERGVLDSSLADKTATVVGIKRRVRRYIWVRVMLQLIDQNNREVADRISRKLGIAYAG